MDQRRYSRSKSVRSTKDASEENCSDTQEVRRRNSTEGFQPWGLVGFAGLECQSGHRPTERNVQSGFPVIGPTSRPPFAAPHSSCLAIPDLPLGSVQERPDLSAKPQPLSYSEESAALEL